MPVVVGINVPGGGSFVDSQALEAEVGRRRSTSLRRRIQDNFAQHCGVQAPHGQHERQQTRGTHRRRKQVGRIRDSTTGCTAIPSNLGDLIAVSAIRWRHTRHEDGHICSSMVNESYEALSNEKPASAGRTSQSDSLVPTIPSHAHCYRGNLIRAFPLRGPTWFSFRIRMGHGSKVSQRDSASGP